MTVTREEKSTPLAWQLTIISLARLLLNTGLRMVYPFAPALARGLGVELTAVYRLITIRNFSGFFSPFFGPLSERYGRRKVMAGSILFLSLGCLAVVIWPAYWPLGVTLAAISLAKVVYDPAMQAYVGDTVPYQQRGKAIAVTEFAWAGALLVGAPAVGYAIAQWGWQSPFAWLGGLGLIAAVFLYRVLPANSGRTARASTLRQIVTLVRQNPVIWATGAYIALVMTANEILFIVYGDWMEQSFGLALTSLGLASGVVGGAEILGELFAGWSVDRFGKRRVIITTGIINALLYLLIPFAAVGLTAALVTLFLLFFTFEATVVGGVPLFTEVVPRARGIVMSVVMASFSVGRTLGSYFGPLVADRYGFVGNGMASALLMLLALGILVRWVREGETDGV